MKAVMLSIQPKWCELIALGKKTVEVRKTKPKLETPFKVYIYMTMGKCPKFVYNENLEKQSVYDREPNTANGRVIGEFVRDEIFPIRVFENGSIQDYVRHSMERSCVPYDDISAYIGKDKTGYGWHITDLVIYDKPKELSEFYQEGKNGDKFYYDYCAGCPHHETPVGDDPCNGCDGNRNYFYRPPQSWCYCEELKGD